MRINASTEVVDRTTNGLRNTMTMLVNYSKEQPLIKFSLLCKVKHTSVL